MSLLPCAKYCLPFNIDWRLEIRQMSTNGEEIPAAPFSIEKEVYLWK